MAMRSVIVSRIALRSLTQSHCLPSIRCYSDGKGRVLDEEERAQETVYIHKMEKEKLEKLKKKAEQDNKKIDDKSDKKAE